MKSMEKSKLSSVRAAIYGIFCKCCENVTKSYGRQEKYIIFVHFCVMLLMMRKKPRLDL